DDDDDGFDIGNAPRCRADTTTGTKGGAGTSRKGALHGSVQWSTNLSQADTVPARSPQPGMFAEAHTDSKLLASLKLRTLGARAFPSLPPDAGAPGWCAFVDDESGKRNRTRRAVHFMFQSHSLGASVPS